LGAPERGRSFDSMPTPSLPTPPGLKLEFADRQRWFIRPADNRAAAVVAGLGRAMQLGSVRPPERQGDAWRELCVAVCGESDLSDLEASGAAVCRLAASTGSEAEVAKMRRIASQIAREAMSHGGLLFHGALAEYRGSGFLMGGPGEVGKSTASRRLPPPWRSLSDDMALVVRDGNGQFWAHPWPTWSRLLYNGPGGSWDVEHAVPLRALFFLDQSPFDRLEPISGTQATALAMESAEELAREVLFVVTDADAVRSLCAEALTAARNLAAAVPAYTLRLTADGRFWEMIEGVLPLGDSPAPTTGSQGRDPVSVESLTARESLRVVCTGPSMIPTFDEPDLLEVKPYGRAPVRRGDVVCFKSPGTGKAVVHRVVAIGPDGVRTRGDNNEMDDPWVLRPRDIAGCVRAAQRGNRRRAVHGGRRGLWALHFARLVRCIRIRAALVLNSLYNTIAALGPFDRVLPPNLRPRLVRFDTRYRAFLKLLMGRRVVGQYDPRSRKWRVHRPFSLFASEEALSKAVVLVNKKGASG
jgi:SynChlorMet cassette protein ScmC